MTHEFRGTAEETEADLIRTTERIRLRALVEADLAVAHPLHADDFELITPGGNSYSREQYLGDIASGAVDYILWEPASEIRVKLYGDVAVIRYRSQIDIEVQGERSSAPCWHTDLYEKRNGSWQVVWAQATAIRG